MKSPSFLLISVILFFISVPQLMAQVGVGTTSPQGALDITSSTNGVVVPRVALTSKSIAAPIVNPQTGALAEGTLVWNTATAGTGSDSVFPGFYFWKGGLWNELADGSGKDWSTEGNTGTAATTNFIGTTDNTDLVFKTDNINRMTINNSDVDPITGTIGDISIGDINSGTIKANKELVMRQDQVSGGSSILRLVNRFGENGAMFETTGPNVVDFFFKTGPIASPFVSNIRFEARAASKKIATNETEFQIGKPDASNGGPTLVIGANGTGSKSSFRIGNLGVGTVNPTEKLHVNGNLQLDGAIMPGGVAGTTDQILISKGPGIAPAWGPGFLNTNQIRKIGKYYVGPFNSTTYTLLIITVVDANMTTNSAVTVNFWGNLPTGGPWWGNDITVLAEPRAGAVRFHVGNWSNTTINNLQLVYTAFYN